MSRPARNPTLSPAPPAGRGSSHLYSSPPPPPPPPQPLSSQPSRRRNPRSPENHDVQVEIDYQAVETASMNNSPKRKDLDAVLPKLARRISSQQVRTEDNIRSPEPETKPSNPDSMVRKRRVSVTRSGSVAFMPSPALPPELEELRSRDIEPDVDSAADRALAMAAAIAQANQSQPANAAGTANHRGSIIIDQPQEKNIVEGREIQQGHEQYALTYGMMLGIRVTTGRRDFNLDALSRSKSLSSFIVDEQELSPADYDSVAELVFKPEGNTDPPYPTPPHKLNFTFTFKDYMTNVFRAVRALSNIDEADYMLSLAGDFNYIEFIANSKSGQFFFYSHDGKYMIKTQSKEESKLLRRIMPLYIQHLTNHPDSLLVRFYGMHRVKMKSLRSKTYFVIMSSVFNTPRPITVKFDLKGSTVGRLTSPEDCRAGAVQKDLNLMESGTKIRLGPENIDIFYETLKADVTFLKNQNIMDYSLLLGIHQGNRRPPSRRRSSGVVLSSRSSLRVPHADEASPASSPLRRASSNRETGESPRFSGSMEYDNPVRRTASGNLVVGKEDGKITGGSLFTSYYGGIRSSPEVNEVYFMGIIDILQLYNSQKQMENFFKGFTHDRKQLSAVDPGLYAERMLNFVMQHTDYPEIMDQRKKEQKSKAAFANKRKDLL